MTSFWIFICAETFPGESNWVAVTKAETYTDRDLRFWQTFVSAIWPKTNWNSCFEHYDKNSQIFYQLGQNVVNRGQSGKKRKFTVRFQNFLHFWNLLIKLISKIPYFFMMSNFLFLSQITHSASDKTYFRHNRQSKDELLISKNSFTNSWLQNEFRHRSLFLFLLRALHTLVNFSKCQQEFVWERGWISFTLVGIIYYKGFEVNYTHPQNHILHYCV